MSNIYKKLSTSFEKLNFEQNYELKNLTYFKVGGPAEVFIKLKDHQQINLLHKFCFENSIPLTIFGGASNVVVDDKGINGLVIKIEDDTFEVVSEKDTTMSIQVGAGLKTSLLVKQAIDHSLMGLEKFLGVPGTVGGAVYNNAHYLEELIGDHISKVKVSDIKKGIIWLDKNELSFDYDKSRFQKTNEIILTVEFNLKRGDPNLSKQLVKEATQYRAQTQPLGMPSSGCIFQNVPNNPDLRKRFPQFSERKYISGGFIIDQAGLKGHQIGDIEVSQKHAAFFVNHGRGTAEDVKNLVAEVKKTVKEKFNINLKEEIFYLK